MTINGLPLMPAPGDWPAGLPPLDRYYEECVSGGVGSFVLPVAGIENFGMALRAKLILEIAGAPNTIWRASAAKPLDCSEFD